jgi:twitching motility protein PilT
MARIDTLLSLARAQGGTDLHVLGGSPARIRLRGELDPLAHPALSAAELSAAMHEILSPSQLAEFQEHHEVEATYGLPGVARFRVSYFETAAGPAAVFRVVPEVPIPLATLSLPAQFEGLLASRSGLVLVTAPAGSGRSTLHASLVDHFVATSSRLVVSIEDPVEVVHLKKTGVAIQREVGRDTASFATGIAAALRSDAEVLVVGDLPDAATTRLALRAAEAGRLVVACPQIPGAVRALERLVERFGPGEQLEIRSLFADNLRGVLAQILVRRSDALGRVAAHELLIANADLRSALIDGELRELGSVLETGRAAGMVTLDDSLEQLVAVKAITPEEANRRASDKSRFASQLRQSAS